MAVKVGHMECWHTCVWLDTVLRRESTGWGDIPNGINSSKEEGCDHELSVWSLRLDGWWYDQLKSRFVRGPMMSLVLNLLNLRCPWDIYQQIFMPDTVHREYWSTSIDMSCSQVAKMRLANIIDLELRYGLEADLIIFCGSSSI